MNFDLPTDVADLVAAARDFREERLDPLEADFLRDGNVPWPLRPRLQAEARERGPWAIDVPREHGGLGMGQLAVCAVHEELNKHPMMFETGGAPEPVLYHCDAARIRHMAPFEEHSLEVFRRTIDVNVVGTFIRSQAVRRMLPDGGGRIVNLASIAARLALRNRAAYNAGKGAVMALTRSTAVDRGSRRIYCNATAPGLIETPLSAEYFRDEAMRSPITENTPLGRWGQGNEVAEPTVFLCSPASDFVQGETLFVDGGWNAGKGY